ncbi:MAG: hypothetical protein RL173_1879 [Fibrobacterota bacterium]|jgi:hypothetical protein
MIPERQNHAADRRGEAEPRRVKFRPRTVFVATLSVLGLFGCDQTKTTQGGSADETSTIAFYRPDGKPAAGARVMIYGTADTGASPRDQVITNANGSVELPALGKGFYNLVVRQDGKAIFQDSLFSNGERMLASSDTLRATGVLAGRVRVQSQHSPRIAWIHLLGAGKYLNVDDSGFFRMEGIPQGKFTMAALTREGGYTPTFKEVRAVSDSVVDVGDIELVYTGLPVIKNLEARFDTLTGIVYLRWDSTALRQTWHYNVYRDDILLGQTTGPRWNDTVSDEYPGNVPSQGLHTYRVALANADSVGSKWESITMRIISAYLYQEVKIDWEKRSELPWPSGLFRIDTAGGDLVGWRSAEFGTELGVGIDGSARINVHTGWIEMWVSTDSGRNWIRKIDSLELGALPVRYRGKWWSVRRGERRIGSMDSAAIEAKYSTPVAYPSVVVMESSDGIAWDSVESLSFESVQTAWRFELDESRLILVGGCANSNCGGTPFSQYQYDMSLWSLQAAGWRNESMSDGPLIGYGALFMKRVWNERWWEITRFGDELDGRALPPAFTLWSMVEMPINNILFPMRIEGGKILFFRMTDAISLDSSGSYTHALAWPGKGPHYETKFKSRILSISDSGVYLGRILSGTQGGDPRGTWVKQTEIPTVF